MYREFGCIDPSRDRRESEPLISAILALRLNHSLTVAALRKGTCDRPRFDEWLGMHPRIRRQHVAAGLLCVLTLAAFPASNPSEKLPIPKMAEADQARPRQLMRNSRVTLRQGNFTTRAPRPFTQTAEQLQQNLESGCSHALGLAARAHEQAVDAGDLNAAFDAIDAIVESFVIKNAQHESVGDDRRAGQGNDPAGPDHGSLSQADRSITDDGDIDLAQNTAQLAGIRRHPHRTSMQV